MYMYTLTACVHTHSLPIPTQYEFRLMYDQMVSLVLMSAQYTFLLDTVWNSYLRLLKLMNVTTGVHISSRLQL